MTHDHDLELRPTPAQISAALNPPPGRNGGDLVVETLAGLGAIAHYLVGDADLASTIQLVVTALMGATLRNGIATSAAGK